MSNRLDQATRRVNAGEQVSLSLSAEVWLYNDDFVSTPTVYDPNCSICRDEEFAQMGLPLCYACFICGAHVPADDPTCAVGHRQATSLEEEEELRNEYSTINGDKPQ